MGAWADLVLWLRRDLEQEGPVERQFRQFLADGIVARALKLKEMSDQRDALNERFIQARDAR